MARPWFSFIRGIVPLGNSNLANAKTLGLLPRYSLIGFPQFRYYDPIREFGPPQIEVQQAWLTAGIGGLIAGNVVMQPLNDNPALMG